MRRMRQRRFPRFRSIGVHCVFVGGFQPSPGRNLVSSTESLPRSTSLRAKGCAPVGMTKSIAEPPGSTYKREVHPGVRGEVGEQA